MSCTTNSLLPESLFCAIIDCKITFGKNKLTAELFARAAERASLSAEIFDKPVDKIKNGELPAILLLEKGEACILIQDEQGKRKVIDPKTPAEHLEPAAILANYTGQTILVQPEYKYTTRAEETLGKPPKNWFWKVFLKILANLLRSIGCLPIN
ncbi:cysteine peptidase family C39 domain-containing protein [Legionella tunisiensis]|uniref:hypothetical protein n=1 Tax=Legionella tunisiensis TaxID=1034944 RepID=UPI0002D76DA0|nr:hypothetical protein [Legionella tunisiensis]